MRVVAWWSVLAVVACAGDGAPQAESGASTGEVPGTSEAESGPGGENSNTRGMTTDDEPPDEEESSDGEEASAGSSGEPPPEGDWCLYEVVAGTTGLGLDVHALPDATSPILYRLEVGETVWGGNTVTSGYRDLDRSLAMPAWGEDARLSNTGECEDAEKMPEVIIPQGMQLPFVCGDAWRLDSWAHAPAIDMVREPDQVGTEGAPLVAPAAGTVNQSFYHDNAGNTVQIDHGGGYFTTYLHMESRAVEVGAVVAMGDPIGAVGRTGPTSNNHPHLHFELGFDADGDGEASWGFSGAERVNPWFDNVEYGQDNGLTWRDVVSNNCP
jgi:hypothetical protein